MAYAQRNYQQIQGMLNPRNGVPASYTIAQIGCFLTAMCNLESDFNVAVAPDVLDLFFKQRGYYVDVDDKQFDDLNWDTITKYDGLTKVSNVVDHGTAQTAGWPDSDKAIVRFYYRSSQTNQMTYHFCKVAVAGAHTIIDSYDGKLKSSPYGEPTAWATYTHDVPQAVSVAPPKPLPYSYTTKEPFSVWTKQATTLWNLQDMSPIGQVPAYFEVKAVAVAVHTNGKYYYMYDTNSPAGYWADDMSTTNTTPVITIDPIPVPDVPKPQTVPAAPVRIPTARKYTLLTTIKWYGHAGDALGDMAALGTLAKGEYYVHGEDKGMLWLNKNNMDNDQQWINPRHNKVEEASIAVVLPPVLQVEPPKLPEIVIQPEATEPAQPQPDDLVMNGPNVWKSQTEYLFDDGLPITLQSTNSIPVKIKALDGKLPNTIDLPAHRKLDIIKRFPYNGVWYYQDTMLSDAGRFYALPSAMFPDPYETDQKLATLDINRDGDVNFSDFVDYGSRKFKSGVAVLNSVAKIVASKNVQAVRKSIDGIRKKDRTK